MEPFSSVYLLIGGIIGVVMFIVLARKFLNFVWSMDEVSVLDIAGAILLPAILGGLAILIWPVYLLFGLVYLASVTKVKSKT
jgi:hypothetical protein